MKLLLTQDQESPVYQVALAGRGPFALSSSATTGEVFAWEGTVRDRLTLVDRFGWGGGRLRNRRPPDPSDLFETRDDRLVHRVVHFAFHPDGDHFAVIGPNQPVTLRRLPGSGVLRSFGGEGQFKHVAFTRDGDQLAARPAGRHCPEQGYERAVRL